MLRLEKKYVYFLRFAHRAAAALFAMIDLLVGDNLLALAFPPFRPPSRPSATAFGFLPSSDFGSGGALPVASSTIRLASWFRSRGRLLERLGMR